VDVSQRQGRYRVKRDANQGEIEGALTEAHYIWHDTSRLGSGFPDLVALSRAGRIVMLEIKAPGGSMTKDERDFHLLWTGAPLYVVRSGQEAVDVLEGL
jgi:hypothetical protein